MRYTTLDVETTQNNKGEDARGKFAASPFHPDNYVVYLGMKELDGEYDMIGDPASERLELDADVLIGHNIKFDLHYCNKFHDMKEWVANGGMIWDTMVAEYILSGQSSNGKTPGTLKLGTVLANHGLQHTLKDTVSEYFESGMGADEIPEDEILPYLKEDVTLTEKLFERQCEVAIDAGMMPLIVNMMEATLATWVMEAEGSRIDTGALRAYGDTISGHLGMYTQEARELVEDNTSYPEFNPNSDQQLSALLFGGEVKYTYDEPVMEDGEPVVYKSGKRKGMPKYRKATAIVTLPKRFEPTLHESVKGKKTWGVTDAVLNSILDNGSGDKWVFEVVKRVQDVRSLKKELSTYVDGYLSRVWHDGLLHPEYSTTMTETGRLSCRNPNLQNIKGRE